MSEVHRYYVQLFKLAGDQQKYAHGALGAVEVVKAKYYDAAQSELAALREELAAYRRLNDSLMARNLELTAAEQRNADAIGKLELAASMMDDDERGNRFAEVCRIVIKALKPTESGASELDPKIIGIVPMPPMEYDEP